MLKTVIANTAAEMDRLRSAWDKLHSCSRQHTIFQSFAWNRLAARVFAGREQPFVIFVENGHSALLLPACVSADGIGLLGETLFDYRDVLGGDADLLRHAFDILAALRRPLRITALRGAEAAQRWGALQPAPFCRAPQVLHYEITSDAFAAVHTRSARSLRRLLRQGVELRQHDGRNSALIAEIYRRKAACGNGELFRDAARVMFMVETASVAASGCEVFTLEHGDTLVAALVTFRDRGVRRFYTVYFDPAWAKWSPGQAILFEVVRRTLEAGEDCDLLTGEQPYKMRLATSSVPLFTVEGSAQVLKEAAATPTEVAA